jgi:hypothetical protein
MSTTIYSSSIILTYDTYDGLHQPIIRPGIFANVASKIPPETIPPLANPNQSRQDAITTYWAGYIQYSSYDPDTQLLYIIPTGRPISDIAVKPEGVMVIEAASNALPPIPGLGNTLVEERYIWLSPR